MPAALAVELARGVPLALATAVPLWAATMAGGLADDLRGARDGTSFVVVEGRATSVAILFSLAAALLFLTTGGPARAVLALAAPRTTPWLAAATDLAGGIGLAVAIAAPILAASVVLEISGALVARAASPAHVDALISPLKAIALLVFIALGLDRMLALVR
jgi:type III secretory pathway component EscT